MEQIIEQFPIVIKALNVGFLQTLKLFFVTLLGALPLGLIISFGSMSRFKPISYFTRFIVCGIGNARTVVWGKEIPRETAVRRLDARQDDRRHFVPFQNV